MGERFAFVLKLLHNMSCDGFGVFMLNIVEKSILFVGFEQIM